MTVKYPVYIYFVDIEKYVTEERVKGQLEIGTGAHLSVSAHRIRVGALRKLAGKEKGSKALTAEARGH